MRESNFAFPAQNRACVCISSQLYDRRALDTTSPLPLLNSLTHLTYLTSTSPRIREILTCDGGLERLVRLLRDFCLSPPPPDNPSAVYGLSPPALPRPAPLPTLNPKSFDRHAAYRFSLAFQCVVNIGVRGSEPIRSRVVQAGTLDVVGCVLEGWLASKGFAVGPSASASGLPRESKEQRALRRQHQIEQRQREQAQELARLLALQSSNAGEYEDDEDMGEISQDITVATSDAETSASTDTSANATPLGSGTPTGHVNVPGRDRSGTVVARPVWDIQPPPVPDVFTLSRNRTVRGGRPSTTGATAPPSASTSRPDTETEDDGEHDGDGDIEMSQDTDENIPPPPHPHVHAHLHPRRAVGIVSDTPPPTATTGGPSDSLEVDLDAHIIINTTNAEEGMGGVEDGIVALEQNVNDDLAMGAPPGAPGAIDGTPRVRANTLTFRDARGAAAAAATAVGGREELTPRAVLAALPMHTPMPVAMPMQAGAHGQPGVGPLPTALRNVHLGAPGAQDAHARVVHPGAHLGAADTLHLGVATGAAAVRHHHHHHRHAQGHHGHHVHIEQESGPFREEDVLLSLQLLAYLSKYPHVRQAFYKPRASFHPVTAQLPRPFVHGSVFAMSARAGPSGVAAAHAAAVEAAKKDIKDHSFFKNFTGRGKEKAPATVASTASTVTSSTATAVPPQRLTNVFSLVERFTFRPSPTESSLPSPPPFLPPEIQYWAGVIMRNACRKDESRGGIRQCANMLCGKWESFPREFAKCRRCRKAKYCGKECQSRAWSEGHRFWCSAREGEEGAEGGGLGQPHVPGGMQGQAGETEGANGAGGDGGAAPVVGLATTTTTAAAAAARVERRSGRERERQRMAAAAGTEGDATADGNAAAAAAAAEALPAAIANAVRATTAYYVPHSVATGSPSSGAPLARSAAAAAAAARASMETGLGAGAPRAINTAVADGARGARNRTYAMAGPSVVALPASDAVQEGGATATATATATTGRVGGPAAELLSGPGGMPAISRRRAGTMPAVQDMHDLMDDARFGPYARRPALSRLEFGGMASPTTTDDDETERIVGSRTVENDLGVPSRGGDDMVLG